MRGSQQGSTGAISAKQLIELGGSQPAARGTVFDAGTRLVAVEQPRPVIAQRGNLMADAVSPRTGVLDPEPVTTSAMIPYDRLPSAGRFFRGGS